MAIKTCLFSWRLSQRYLNEFKNSKNFKDFKFLEYLKYAPCVWAKGQSDCSKSYTNFLNNLKYSDNSFEDKDIALSKLCW